MKYFILLLSIVLTISSCKKNAVITPEPVVEKIKYTVAATPGVVPTGTIQTFTITGTDIQPVTASSIWIMDAEIPKGKSTTITLTGTVGNPWLRVIVYKGNTLTDEYVVADKSANNMVSVTFTTK